MYLRVKNPFFKLDWHDGQVKRHVKREHTHVSFTFYFSTSFCHAIIADYQYDFYYYNNILFTQQTLLGLFDGQM